MTSLEKWEKDLRAPDKSQEELENMLNNAKKYGSREHAAVALDILNERFPNWNNPRTRKGGATPTTVTFKGVKREFPTAKDAYVWLIEEFITAYPEPFENVDFETYFIAKGKAHKCLYFARSPERLFYTTPDLANNPSNHYRLSNGWYANVVLNNEQKRNNLMRFAAVAKLSLDDWSWKVSGQDQSSYSLDGLLSGDK